MILEIQPLLILLLLIVTMACLYSSVGHGGASGYIAAMALMGLSVLEMKPSALTMNIAVSALALFYFARYFSWKLFIPLVVASIPMAYLGGSTDISSLLLKVIIGISLVLAALRMFSTQQDISTPNQPSVKAVLVTGGILGYVAGLTGVGGAIYLSPVIYMMRWADMRTNAAVSAGFVFVNSIAGLMGYVSNGNVLSTSTGYFVIAALAGAIIGAKLGSRMIEPSSVRKLLGVVLIVAGVKLIFTAIA